MNIDKLLLLLKSVVLILFLSGEFPNVLMPKIQIFHPYVILLRNKVLRWTWRFIVYCLLYLKLFTRLGTLRVVKSGYMLPSSLEKVPLLPKVLWDYFSN